MERHTNLASPDPKKLLHVAPEESLARNFKALSHIDYVSADLNNPRAMVKMDITDIQYPDNSFDIIYCSHVLEHVPNDRKAISEFLRVLKPEGWALLKVPMFAEKTFEDPSISTAKDRKKHYGQFDHVRACGPDYIDRIIETGFDAETVLASDILSEEEGNTFGISLERRIFYCKKNQNPKPLHDQV